MVIIVLYMLSLYLHFEHMINSGLPYSKFQLTEWPNISMNYLDIHVTNEHCSRAHERGCQQIRESKFYEDNYVIRELLYGCNLDNNKRFGA